MTSKERTLTMLSLSRAAFEALPLNLLTDDPKTLSIAFHIPIKIATLLIQKQWATIWYTDYAYYAENRLKNLKITRLLEAQSDPIVNAILLGEYSASINALYKENPLPTLEDFLFSDKGSYFTAPIPSLSWQDDEAFSNEPRSTPLEDKMSEYGLNESDYH